MIMNNFLGRKPSLTYSLDISLGQFLLTEETIVAKKNQKWNLKTKILEFSFLLLWTVSWYNFDFGTTFFINYQIVCIYQEHKYRINIRNLSLSGFLGTYFLTLLKKDPVETIQLRTHLEAKGKLATIIKRFICPFLWRFNCGICSS